MRHFWKWESWALSSPRPFSPPLSDVLVCMCLYVRSCRLSVWVHTHVWAMHVEVRGWWSLFPLTLSTLIFPSLRHVLSTNWEFIVSLGLACQRVPGIHQSSVPCQCWVTGAAGSLHECWDLNPEQNSLYWLRHRSSSQESFFFSLSPRSPLKYSIQPQTNSSNYADKNMAVKMKK